MEGVIQCQNFQCPSGTYCQDIEDGTSNCADISKGAMGEGGAGVLMTNGIGGRTRREDYFPRPLKSGIEERDSGTPQLILSLLSICLSVVRIP